MEGIYVYDEQRRPLSARISRGDEQVKIEARVPGATDTSRTITILYRVRRGVFARADHDQLYWNAIGVGWDVPIAEAEVIVALPPSVPVAALRTAAYTGTGGAAGRDYAEDRIANMVLFRPTRSLHSREGITVAVDWPRGHVTSPSPLQEARWLLSDNWPLALPVATLLVSGLLWYAYGRDPASNRSVKPEYRPPPDMIPAEAGTLLDERVDQREIIATVVDLAVRGYLHVERVTDAFGTPDFLFKRLKPIEPTPTRHPELKPLELFVLAKLFGADWSLNLRLLSEIRQDYENVFPPIRDETYRSLVTQRLFPSSPGRVRAAWAAAGLAALALASVISVRAPSWSAELGPTLPIGIGASGLVIAAVGWIMPRRTWRGVRGLIQIHGFKDFLERAEKDRLERMPADTLHRWLPWAIALGVSDQWIFRFEGLTVALPAWYTGPGPFSLSSYHDNLTVLGRQTLAAIMSGGSGGAGWFPGGPSGGSAGGGAGGGGGGTF